MCSSDLSPRGRRRVLPRPGRPPPPSSSLPSSPPPAEVAGRSPGSASGGGSSFPAPWEPVGAWFSRAAVRLGRGGLARRGELPRVRWCGGAVARPLLRGGAARRRWRRRRRPRSGPVWAPSGLGRAVGFLRVGEAPWGRRRCSGGGWVVAARAADLLQRGNGALRAREGPAGPVGAWFALFPRPVCYREGVAVEVVPSRWLRYCYPVPAGPLLCP